MEYTEFEKRFLKKVRPFMDNNKVERFINECIRIYHGGGYLREYAESFMKKAIKTNNETLNEFFTKEF